MTVIPVNPSAAAAASAAPARAAASADPSRRVRPLKICILGLSISSSWGNGHATIYRALVQSLARRGHAVTFLERDVPWYANSRDCPAPRGTTLHLYDHPDQLRSDHAPLLGDADLVILGSYVPDGIGIADLIQRDTGGVKAFYDIDTPITLSALARGDCAYLDRRQIPGFDIYFSFTGGRSLRILEDQLGSPAAVPLYCAVDCDFYQPDPAVTRDLDLGYMGTYSIDRQPTVNRFLLEPAKRMPEARFALVGPMYPPEVVWPSNVERIEHLPPAAHPRFYNRQRYTLNVTRDDMKAAGHAPSVRLFEAAACGTPIISDRWVGIDELFSPGSEILLADDVEDVLHYLRDIPEADRQAIGEAARKRVAAHHTADHRAAELEAATLAAAR